MPTSPGPLPRHVSDPVAEAGCAIGSLRTELKKQGRGLDLQAALLVAPSSNRPGIKFREMGRPDAHNLAVTFFSMVEGRHY